VETILQFLVFIVGSVALALFGVVHVRRRVPLEVQMEQNEVAGFFIAVLGVVYGVLLAFAVILVWEQFEDAKTIAETEANELGDIYHLANGLPEPVRVQVQTSALAYANVVIEEEWPMMRRGSESPAAWRQLSELWTPALQFAPSTPREQAIYAEVLQRLDQLNDARRMRLLASRSGVPHLIWGILIGGGVVTVLFTYFFGLKNMRAQMAMTAMYVAAIGFVLFLVAAIDNPFSGTVSIKPEALELVLNRIAHFDGTPR
jgi:hypothetical protein